ncbi:MAG: hypothetical protein F6K63_13855 [Moorea sp. SIO1G6]|uniref:hypothetical protein n=1 Tax=Moorena sp. SIO1G6 TaxID=2607840 RepID=UPI0013BF37FE|nr:hypothetical protein [Moorena sp. SIO1G6]NET65403.1 hypothetical protein [Moorena sp. SIO1G6]
MGSVGSVGSVGRWGDGDMGKFWELGAGAREDLEQKIAIEIKEDGSRKRKTEKVF